LRHRHIHVVLSSPVPKSEGPVAPRPSFERSPKTWPPTVIVIYMSYCHHRSPKARDRWHPRPSFERSPRTWPPTEDGWLKAIPPWP
jgi:hypothetical protein